MVHDWIDGTFRQTNLQNESPEYLAKREEVRLAEIELMRQRERVAELRRALPPGTTVQDYEFLEGPTSLDDGDEPTRRVHLSSDAQPTAEQRTVQGQKKANRSGTRSVPPRGSGWVRRLDP